MNIQCKNEVSIHLDYKLSVICDKMNFVKDENTLALIKNNDVVGCIKLDKVKLKFISFNKDISTLNYKLIDKQ